MKTLYIIHGYSILAAGVLKETPARYYLDYWNVVPIFGDKSYFYSSYVPKASLNHSLDFAKVRDRLIAKIQNDKAGTEEKLARINARLADLINLTEPPQ